jgi:hypothetical protein
MSLANVFGNVYQYGPYSEGEAPDVGDVRYGVEYADGLIGVLELPLPSQVLVGIGYGSYGTEFEGTLTEAPGGTDQNIPAVRIDGNLRSPLIIGDDYTASVGRAFIWTSDLWDSFDLETGVTRFQGRSACDKDCGRTLAWDITGTITQNEDGSFALSFDLPPGESNQIAAGEYDWWVQVNDVTITGSYIFNETVTWECVEPVFHVEVMPNVGGSSSEGYSPTL